MNRNTSLNVITPLLILIFLSSCSAIKNTEEMNQTTKDLYQTTTEMNQTTKEMVGTTGEMKNLTQGMSETTNEMKDLTQGMSDTTRDMKILTELMVRDMQQGLTNERRRGNLETMEKAPTMAAKLVSASHYYMSYEYQIWKNTGLDTREKLDQLYHLAVEEFFMDVRAYFTDRDMQDVGANHRDQNYRNLYALALAMHSVNPNALPQGSRTEGDLVQIREIGDGQEAVEGSDPSQVSMLDLIQYALFLGKEVYEGRVNEDEIPSFARLVLVNREDALFLLRLRANFFPALVIGKLTDADEEGGFSKMLYRKSAQLGLWLTTWTPAKWSADFTHLDFFQVKEYAAWLRFANQSRSFLNSIDEDPMTDRTMLKIFKNMKVKLPEKPSDRATALEKHRYELFMRAYPEFEQEYQQYIRN